MRKKLLSLIVIIFLLIACVPTGTHPTPSGLRVETIVASTLQAMTVDAPPPSAGNTVSFNHITFVIPPELNINATPIVSTDTEYPFIYPTEEPMPEHVRFEFANYPVTSYPENSNEILVFKASEYAGYSENLHDTVTALLAGQDVASPFPESLVDNNFFAQAMSIRFQNGHGVRYLNQVLTGISPINNQELFYYFQGITDDGAYFISARLHTSTPFLVTDSNPNSPTPPDGIPFLWDPNTFNPTAYFHNVEQKLNDTLPENFNPSLLLLDSLIKSINVTNP